jgi:hypothetical protein
MSICVFILGQGSNCCESNKTLQSSLLQTPDSNVEVVAFIEEDSELVTLPLSPVTGMSYASTPVLEEDDVIKRW